MDLINLIVVTTILVCSILAATRTAQILNELKKIKKALHIDDPKEEKFLDRLEGEKGAGDPETK